MKNPNNKVVWVYVHEFIVNDVEPQEDHTEYRYPLSKRLYRAIKFMEDNGNTVYKILFWDKYGEGGYEGGNRGFLTNTLAFKSATMAYEMSEVTPDTITDFELDSEDYLRVAKWRKDPYEGLKPILKEEYMTSEEIDRYAEANPIPPELEYEEEGEEDVEVVDITGLTEFEQDNVKFASSMVPNLASIHSADPDFAKAVGEIVRWLAQVFGANLHKTQIRELEEYTSSIANHNIYDVRLALEYHKKSPDKLMMFQALSSLLTELKALNNEKRQ